jgi:hypothetical protein
MDIETFIAPISEAPLVLEELISNAFNLRQEYVRTLIASKLNTYFSIISENAWILVESPYIDKVYRDSYYNYLSSKLTPYPRDCIRVSFFKEKISEKDFKSESLIKNLLDNYWGFIVIRPTDPLIVGRSTISPQAMKKNDFRCCTVKIHSTANCIKLHVEGFPHSSQDTETITCAETTIWSLMEYFGNKYPEYKPVLPSTIAETLKKVSPQRQIPSKGLNIQQMAYALKEFGFATRFYSNLQFLDSFHSLLSTYIESGIPVVTAIENRSSGGNIGHALLCIGHENISDSMIDALSVHKEQTEDIKKIIVDRKIALYDWDDIEKAFIFIDDNQAPYQMAKLSSPSIHYRDAAWHTCTITNFIVPFYSKINLEAFEAKNLSKQYLFKYLGSEIKDSSELLIRFYLASSRSYKEFVATAAKFNDEITGLILETSLPKFIWVAEISDKTLIKQQEAFGVIIIDATEANIYSGKPFILAGLGKKFLKMKHQSGDLEIFELPLQNYSIFQGNLNKF